MMKRSFTILIVPHTGEQFRKLRLTSGGLRTLTVSAALLMVAAVFLAAHYLAFYRDLSELRQLRLSNSELKRQNLDYELSVEHLNGRVSSLQDFVRKLSVMAGLDATVEADSDEGGVGGPHDVDYTSTSGAFAEVKGELDRMRGELTDLERKSLVLERFYEHNNLMLASTPSIWPVRGYFSSTFGMRNDPFTGEREMHYGIDISTTVGRPVVATADGIVLYAARRGSYGNIVVIDHKFGVMTRYAHLSAFNTRPGQLVKRGDVVGFVGNTGRSSAPHLHYEVWVQDRPVTPLDYILEYNRSFDPKNRPLRASTTP
jgi:murein DD-endopeptidase MepM/ murein hydrolase activator NlpD